MEEWVTKENYSGIIVRKELIHWFAERVARRDRTSHEIQADFAEQFLSRHEDLARKLRHPAAPSHEAPKPDSEPKRGIARLNEMREKTRTRALYGDSPPPPREHAPFPDGDIIHHLLSRYVVRHGDTVTKYTTSPYGFATGDQPNEALALAFIAEHTTIPVPRLIESDWDRITMQYVEGQTLQQAWPVLTAEERFGVLEQLAGYIAQLRALGGVYLGRLDGDGVVLPCVMTRSGGPFKTVAEMHDWLVRPRWAKPEISMFYHQITSQLGADYPIVFTHGDIAARNIIIRDGRVVALLDWEFAGFYPEYWEYVRTLRGLDNIDWSTIGQHVPGLFSQRYDLEYILLSFITSVS